MSRNLLPPGDGDDDMLLELFLVISIATVALAFACFAARMYGAFL